MLFLTFSISLSSFSTIIVFSPNFMSGGFLSSCSGVGQLRETEADWISEDAQVRQQLGEEHCDDEEDSDVDEDVSDKDGDNVDD